MSREQDELEQELWVSYPDANLPINDLPLQPESEGAPF